jgi:glycosyltransferase involved in cell wall biosynthesis
MISACITSLNEEKMISNCIKALINQVDEIIICDAGSKDKTVTISRALGAKVYVENSNASEGRNCAAKRSKGDYLLFIDGDCIATPNLVKKLKDGMSARVGAVYAKVLPTEKDWRSILFCEIISWTNYLPFTGKGPIFMVKKDLFCKAGGYNEQYVCGEDVELTLRLMKHTRIKFASEAVVYTTMRRMKGQGYTKTLVEWLANYVCVLFGFSRQSYQKYR